MFACVLGIGVREGEADSMSMPGVVYLASWPRSGNTLLRAILWQCFGLESCSMYDEDALFVNNPDWHKLTGAIPSPRKMKDLQEIIDRQGVALFKMHTKPDEPDNPVPATLEGFEGSIPIRVIYLVRDGREACVSYWHFLREIGGAPDTTLQEVIRGDCPFGSWSEHVNAWCQAVIHTQYVLLLQYEDVVADTGGRESPLSIYHCTGVRKEDSRIALARFISGACRVRTDIDPWQDFHQSDPLFFRSGTNETWKTEMIGDDLALFDELHGDTMREYGYYPAEEPVYA